MVLLAADRQRPIDDRASERWTADDYLNEWPGEITDDRDVRLPLLSE